MFVISHGSFQGLNTTWFRKVPQFKKYIGLIIWLPLLSIFCIKNHCIIDYVDDNCGIYIRFIALRPPRRRLREIYQEVKKCC